ncbi:hypothetical protein [Yinghuangia soli]|uniref:Lipoprotein n=1 Tax=Yinghuangia soli TaxID=2908204 RepID=A0AA41U2M7_9ACTN|nr:hypothetical protein [Yinghuangia soli]MCF2527264.1 hypothetical protein [Yinghuangia soli]
MSAVALAAAAVVSLSAMTGCSGGGGGGKAAEASASAAEYRELGAKDVLAAVRAATSAHVYTTESFGDASLTGTKVTVRVGADGASEIERTFTREAIELVGEDPAQGLNTLTVRSVGGQHYMQARLMDPSAKSDWPKPWMHVDLDAAGGALADAAREAFAGGFRIPASAVWPIVLMASSPDTRATRQGTPGVDEQWIFTGTVTTSELEAYDLAELDLTQAGRDQLVKALPGNEFTVALYTDGRGLPQRMTLAGQMRGRDGEVRGSRVDVTFSRWNEPVAITAPRPDETFEASDLK